MARPVSPSSGALTPIDDVELQGGFWGDRRRLNTERIIPHCYAWEDRLGWIDNFRDPHGERGREFADSDVYKMVEAMAWDGSFDAQIEDIAAKMAGAQEEDGYLNTRFGHRGREHRYTDLEWGHELYCYGHMIQAAVARLRTGREDRFVEVTRRAADHVCEAFAEQGVCGHPEVEMALVELFRATGEERYLEQARRFVERRGQPALSDIGHGRAYFQDDMPIRDGRGVPRPRRPGAVPGERSRRRRRRDRRHRAAGRDRAPVGAHHRAPHVPDGRHGLAPHRRVVRRGLRAAAGPGVLGDVRGRRLGPARVAAAAGDRRRPLCRPGGADSCSTWSPPRRALDGSGFFYANPLHQRVPGVAPDPDAENMRAASSLRAPWFHVSCCPTNVARTLASLSGYVATRDDGGIQLHQLMPCTIRSGPVTLRVITGYPWASEVVVRVEETGEEPWRLALRVPSWAGEAVLVDRGHRRPVRAGYAVVDAAWRVGDELRLELPMGPRWTRPDPRVDAVRGCVAVERGPVVYCLESTDQEPGVSLSEVLADASDGLADGGSDSGLGGVTVVGAGGRRFDGDAAQLTFIPYHAWGNRGLSTMRVWVPEA